MHSTVEKEFAFTILGKEFFLEVAIENNNYFNLSLYDIVPVLLKEHRRILGSTDSRTLLHFGCVIPFRKNSNTGV